MNTTETIRVTRSRSRSRSRLPDEGQQENNSTTSRMSQKRGIKNKKSSCDIIQDFKVFYASRKFPFIKPGTITTLCETGISCKGNIITRYVFLRMAYLFNLLKTGDIYSNNDLFLKIVKYANTLSNALNNLFMNIKNNINCILFYERIYYFFNNVEKLIEINFEQSSPETNEAISKTGFDTHFDEYLSTLREYIRIKNSDRTDDYEPILNEEVLNEFYTEYSITLPVQKISSNAESYLYRKQRVMNYVYIYLTTIPAPLFFSILDHSEYSSYNPVIITREILISYHTYFYENEDNVYDSIQQITETTVIIDREVYKKHIERILEIPDVTMLEICEGLEANINDISRFEGVLRQTMTHSDALGNPRRTIILDDDPRNYQIDPYCLLNATPLDTPDGGPNGPNGYTLSDTPFQLPSDTTLHRGGSSIDNKNQSLVLLENLIINMHDLIKGLVNPEGMVVKSILEDPFELTDGFFSGKKIVLDWIGLVMSYITFIIGNSVINGDNIIMSTNVNFIPYITYDNPDGTQNKYCYGSEILTCDNSFVTDPPSGFTTTPFSQFMSLITLALTLQHTEGIRQTTARTSYVMLRTSPYYNPSSASRILSIFSYNQKTSKAISNYNIPFEVFHRYIDILSRLDNSPISDCIDTFVKLRYKIVTLLTDVDPTLLELTTPHVLYPRLVKDYRLTLYNPPVISEETRAIKVIYEKIDTNEPLTTKEYNDLSEIIMFQPDIIGGSNSRPASDNWLSNTNSTYNDIIYTGYQTFLTTPGMGQQVNEFNLLHRGLIHSFYELYTTSQIKNSTRYSDNTETFGLQVGEITGNTRPLLDTFISKYAVNVAFNNTFTNSTINNDDVPAIGHVKPCNFRDNWISLLRLIYEWFPKDMRHDCTKERTNVNIETQITSIVDNAFRVVDENMSYISLKKERGKIIPGSITVCGGRSYETVCSHRIIDETQYAKMVNNESINNGNT